MVEIVDYKDIGSKPSEEVVLLRKNTYPKSERLHHRSLVEGLFREGKSIYEFPLRVTWRTMTEEQLSMNFRNNVPGNIGRLQMMVTVPRKKKKKAVDRVLLRRRIREAYRLNRHRLKEKVEESRFSTMSVAIVYIHDKILPYKFIEEKVNIILQKLISKIEKQ